MTRLLWTGLIALLLASPVPWQGLHPTVGAAYADDDDGGGGGDDDDDNGGGGFGGGFGGFGQGGGGPGARPPATTGDGDDPISRFLRGLVTGAQTAQNPRRSVPAPPRAPQTAPLPVPRPSFPDSAPDEIIVFDLLPEDLAALTAQGFTELAAQPLAGLGTVLHRLQVAPGLDLAAARAAVQALPSGDGADFNHYYRTQQASPACEGPHCPPRALIGWPGPESCAPPALIGMIDTQVNAAHEAFAEAALRVRRVADVGLELSDASHGTAVAALLVGAPGGRTPGLVPRAPLVAVDAFHRVGRDDRADTVALLRGLSLLAEDEVAVINLSLAGPPNALLESALTRLIEDTGIAIVAAAGNGGPRAGVAFPAGYEAVIAVTAVDDAGQVYRRVQQGDHVELAAPGVGIWTAASVSGARPRTGTSFAAPFVTAAIARMKAREPQADPARLRAALARSADDLGAAGRDPVFGHGLLRAAGICALGILGGEVFPASGEAPGQEISPASE